MLINHSSDFALSSEILHLLERKNFLAIYFSFLSSLWRAGEHFDAQ